MSDLSNKPKRRGRPPKERPLVQEPKAPAHRPRVYAAAVRIHVRIPADLHDTAIAQREEIRKLVVNFLSQKV